MEYNKECKKIECGLKHSSVEKGYGSKRLISKEEVKWELLEYLKVV